MTIYFYCCRYENKHKKSEIYDYANRYIKPYFPQLPNYANFNTRINALHYLMLALLPIMLQDIEEQEIVKNISQEIALVDISFKPILPKLAGKAIFADKAYCDTELNK